MTIFIIIITLIIIKIIIIILLLLLLLLLLLFLFNEMNFFLIKTKCFFFLTKGIVNSVLTK